MECMMIQTAVPRAVLILGLVAIVAAGCGKKQPPVARAIPPPPPATPASGTRVPAPPEPVNEPTIVPPEPVRDDRISSASLDDLNRDSPLKPVFFELDSDEIGPPARSVLEENAVILKRYATWAVTIEGHCDERGTAETIWHKQPADHGSAEPSVLESDLAGRRAVDGGHHGRGAGRIWRQEQPGRAHRDQVGTRPGEADGQRVVRLRLVHESDRRSQHRRRFAPVRQLHLSVGLANGPLPRSAGTRSAARHRKQRLVVRPIRLPSRARPIRCT